MSLVRVHKRVVVSMVGVLGLRCARTRTVGSEFFRSSHTMRFTVSEEGWCYKLLWEVGFHVEGNSSSSSSFAGRVVLAEKNVNWEINFMVFEFVM